MSNAGQPTFELERDGVKFCLSTRWCKEAIDRVYDVMRKGTRTQRAVASKEPIVNGDIGSASDNVHDRVIGESPVTGKSHVIGESPKGTLSGRGVIHFVDLPELGPVAVKQYRRGGILSFLVKEKYFLSTPSRPAVEWATLHEAEALGINVPTPLGFATEGSLFYKAWLFTREIPQHQSLSEIAQKDISRLAPLVDSLVVQVSKLIAAGIRHVDLHPGNVVVSDTNQVYILDFDKAHRVTLQRRELRDQYVWRWRRAVIKHRLPEQLSELFCLGLRKSAITELD